jgi:hypothetical protein
MPGDTYGGQIELTGFEGEEYKVRASVDVPVSDGFRTRLTAFAGQYEGNINNLTTRTSATARRLAEKRATTKIRTRRECYWSKCRYDEIFEYVVRHIAGDHNPTRISGGGEV